MRSMSESAVPTIKKKSRTWRLWLVALGLTALSFAAVAIPVFWIMPFGHQTPSKLAISYALRRITPFLTVVVALALVALAARIWQRGRWFSRLPLPIPVALSIFLVWFSWQNHFEWMFQPLPAAGFVAASAADFVEPKDMVFGVETNGDAAAYPVRQIAYHHVVNDTVGGVPLAVTY